MTRGSWTLWDRPHPSDLPSFEVPEILASTLMTLWKADPLYTDWDELGQVTVLHSMTEILVGNSTRFSQGEGETIGK